MTNLIRRIGKSLFFVSAGLMLCNSPAISEDLSSDKNATFLYPTEIDINSMTLSNLLKKQKSKVIKEFDILLHSSRIDINPIILSNFFREHLGYKIINNVEESSEDNLIKENMKNLFYNFKKPNTEDSYEYNKFFESKKEQKIEIDFWKYKF